MCAGVRRVPIFQSFHDHAVRVTQPREQTKKDLVSLTKTLAAPLAANQPFNHMQPSNKMQSNFPANKWTTPWHCIFIPIYLKGAACSIWMYKDSILKFHMVKPISFLSNEWHRCGHCLWLLVTFFRVKKMQMGLAGGLNICIIPSIIQLIPKPMRGIITCRSFCLIAKRCE